MAGNLIAQWPKWDVRHYKDILGTGGMVRAWTVPCRERACVVLLIIFQAQGRLLALPHMGEKNVEPTVA